MRNVLAEERPACGFGSERVRVVVLVTAITKPSSAACASAAPSDAIPDPSIDSGELAKGPSIPIRAAVGAPVQNFIAYRITGDRPGAIVALNYPGRASRYEAQVLAALSVTLGALWTLSSRIGQVEEAFLYLVGGKDCRNP